MSDLKVKRFAAGDWSKIDFFKSDKVSLAPRKIGTSNFDISNLDSCIILRDDYAKGTSCQKRQKIYDYPTKHLLGISNNVHNEYSDFLELIAHYPLEQQYNSLPSSVESFIERSLALVAAELSTSDYEAQNNLSFDSVLASSKLRPLPALQFKVYQELDNAQILVHKPIHNYEVFREELTPYTTKMSSVDATLFEENFTVTTIDQSKYDRVSRIGATSGDSQTVVTLDINTEIYPVAVNETLNMVLATSLSIDGSKEDKGWRDVGRPGIGGEATLADMFDYVCHGKLYKFEDSDDGQTIKLFISFGGLLMALEGNYKKLTPLRVDYLYLLIKK